MKRYFGYIRVSTEKQEEHGVSLQEQRDIIQRYASQKALEIARWFEEVETASKVGRPVFNSMLKLLKTGHADGVIIHKVDRGARNFRDWAEIGELGQAGIEVHFATESLDLNTLSGMLSADLQAVMSVHYSRNLREEVKKGFYGRLKQGLYPKPAPLGYLNNGEGKPKTIDPSQGPILKRGFELYATGQYSLLKLTEMLYEMGLRTKTTRKKPGGLRVSRNTIADMLSNPFYFGAIHVKKINRTFVGIHEPLISKKLFDQVQQVKSGKYVRQTVVHHFMFSRMIECAVCGRSLIAEKQKAHIYYRCHTRHKPSAILTEKQVEQKLSELFERLKLTAEEKELIDVMMADTKENWTKRSSQRLQAAELELAAVQDKISRLTDAFLENLIDKPEFERKKTALILERREIERKISAGQNGDGPDLASWNRNVERIKDAYLLYKEGSYDEKREIIKEVVSNRIASAKKLDITVRYPFVEVAKYYECRSGGPPRGRGRKFWRKLITKIVDPAQKDTAHDTLPCA